MCAELRAVRTDLRRCWPTDEASRVQRLQVEVHIGINDGGRLMVVGNARHVLLDLRALQQRTSNAQQQAAMVMCQATCGSHCYGLKGQGTEDTGTPGWQVSCMPDTPACFTSLHFDLLMHTPWPHRAGGAWYRACRSGLSMSPLPCILSLCEPQQLTLVSQSLFSNDAQCIGHHEHLSTHF